MAKAEMTEFLTKRAPAEIGGEQVCSESASAMASNTSCPMILGCYPSTPGQSLSCASMLKDGHG